MADGPVRCSVRAYADRPMLVFRIEATTDLVGPRHRRVRPAVGGLAGLRPRPSALGGGAPDGTRALVFQHCEFGLPSQAGVDLDGFFLLPHRPPTGWPLLLAAPDGRTILRRARSTTSTSRPSGSTAAPSGAGGTATWRGSTPASPPSSLVLAGDGPRACLDEWGRILLERAGTVRPGRWPDALGSRLSYWTDNGAAYWYRTEPGLDPAGSVVAAVDDLRARGRPARQRAARLVVLPPRRPAPLRHRRVGRPAVGAGGLGVPARRPARRPRRPPGPARAIRRWSPTSATCRPRRRSPTRCRWRPTGPTPCPPPPRPTSGGSTSASPGAWRPSSTTGWSRCSSASAGCGPRPVGPGRGRRASTGPPATGASPCSGAWPRRPTSPRPSPSPRSPRCAPAATTATSPRPASSGRGSAPPTPSPAASG